MALNAKHNEEHFHSIAGSRRNDWIKRNEKYYKNSAIPVIITHCDDWLNDPDFQISKKKIQQGVDGGADYHALFDNQH